jgi:hypothetical protein
MTAFNVATASTASCRFEHATIQFRIENRACLDASITTASLATWRAPNFEKSQIDFDLVPENTVTESPSKLFNLQIGSRDNSARQFCSPLTLRIRQLAVEKCEYKICPLQHINVLLILAWILAIFRVWPLLRCRHHWRRFMHDRLIQQKRKLGAALNCSIDSQKLNFECIEIEAERSIVSLLV